MEGNGYTVKELITNFVLPELREIKSEVKGKVDRDEFSKLEQRMDRSEQAQLREDDVVRILGERADKSMNIGMSRMQARLGFGMLIVTAMLLAVSAHAAGVF